MIREWADEDGNEMIDEALATPARYLADTWDDDEAWASFSSAMNAERR
jgi:hypothetical protein